MSDARFPNPGEDARFPSPGVDARFLSLGGDTRFPSPGADTRFAPSLVDQLTALLSPGAAQLLIYPMADMAYLRQDRAGTTPVTAATQNVGRVLDAGPGGYHLTAVSDPARGVFGGAGVTFNGTNTAFATAALPAPGVDKVQVFAAARKASDAALGVIYELSATSDANNGIVFLRAPHSPSVYFLSASKGTTLQTASTGSALYAAPYRAPVTVLGDISGDLSSLRIGGAQVAQSTGDQGTGNYNPSGTYPLFVGARGGSSLFFNGSTALLIVRFGPNLDADTIAAVEALLAPYAEALT